VKNWQVGGSKKGNGRTRWSTNCDYPNVNFNIYSGIKFMFDRSQCGDHCLSIKSCSHFVWVNSICYVKDFRGAPIVQTLDKVIPLCGFIPVSKFQYFKYSCMIYSYYNTLIWVIRLIIYRKD